MSTESRRRKKHRRHSSLPYISNAEFRASVQRMRKVVRGIHGERREAEWERHEPFDAVEHDHGPAIHV